MLNYIIRKSYIEYFKYIEEEECAKGHLGEWTLREISFKVSDAINKDKVIKKDEMMKMYPILMKQLEGEKDESK